MRVKAYIPVLSKLRFCPERCVLRAQGLNDEHS